MKTFQQREHFHTRTFLNYFSIPNFGAHFYYSQIKLHSSYFWSRRVSGQLFAPPQKCGFDIQMTIVFWCFNNLSETAATPQQRLGNVVVINIAEHCKDQL